MKHKRASDAGGKPYECDICKKTFSRWVNWTRVTRYQPTHKGKKQEDHM